MTTAFAFTVLPSSAEMNTTGSPSKQDHTYLTQIGLRVRVLRTSQRLSQEKLAKLAGLDRTYIGRLERGQHNLTVLTLMRLAQALNIPTKELLP